MKTLVAMVLVVMWSVGTVHAADAAKSPAQTAQQKKMKLCNQQEKEQKLKVDERKVFMSQCLKKDEKG
jgi:hypothetical protein